MLITHLTITQIIKLHAFYIFIQHPIRKVLNRMYIYTSTLKSGVKFLLITYLPFTQIVKLQVFYVFIQHPIRKVLTLEGTRLKKLHEGMGVCVGGGGGEQGQSIGPLPSTFDTIPLIDLIFGTYNELFLYFQIIETAWSLICFHGNHNHINDVTSH